MDKKQLDLSVLDVLNFTNEIKDMPHFSYEAYIENSEKSHYKIFYNFIKSFSKIDYNDYNKNVDSSFLDKIYNNLLSKNNSFILSSFLEIGVFVDKLSPASKWLLEFINKESSFDDKAYIYDAISSIETSKSNLDVNLRKIDHESLFYEVFTKFCFESRLNINLISKYLDEFYLTNKTTIVNFLFDISKENSHNNVMNLILTKYQGENIQNDFNLNALLPKTKYNHNKPDKFFIYDSDRRKIKKLTELGFKIDDNNYLFDQKTLFLILVEIKNTMMNYSFSDYSYLLEHVKNFNGATPEDIELFSKDKEYKSLKAQYEYNFISTEIVNQNNMQDKKIKI